MARALLEVDNVSKIYSVGFIRKRYIEAVRSISFIIPDKGAFIGLVGESGSGKTTIARMILGLINPSSGEIRYKGRNIFRLSKEEWIEYRKNVQPVFQDPYNAYNPFYRIDRVLRIPIRTFRLASSKEDAEKLIEEAMMAVGLRPEDILGRYPHQLSGGERQRIMLARLHIIKPRLIVADEPLSMVDVSLKARFLNELLKFKKAYGTSCLYITHDLSEAYYISDTLMVLCRGRIVERGPTDSIINNPAHPYTRML
ncbi:MAG: ABC transporter ATP-binding protein, partial [Thermoprotei archaeon]